MPRDKHIFFLGRNRVKSSCHEFSMALASMTFDGRTWYNLFNDSRAEVRMCKKAIMSLLSKPLKPGQQARVRIPTIEILEILESK